MTDAERLKNLLVTGKSVFSIKDLERLWNIGAATTKIAAKRMVDRKLLSRLERGYYALSNDFDAFELANLIISPSYVSLHSALFHHGISFQESRLVTSVARMSYERRAAGLTLRYFAMKPSLFFNLEGILYKKNIALASPERALLDCFYFRLLPNLDNPEKINPVLLRRIADYYPLTVRAKARSILRTS